MQLTNVLKSKIYEYGDNYIKELSYKNNYKIIFKKI